MRRFKILAALAATLSCFATISTAIAKDRSWVKIGSESAAAQTIESDTINVNNRSGFSNLRVTAVRNGIYLRRVVVTFGNDEIQRFVIDKLIDEGDHSPVLDLIGPRRNIQRVRLEYVSRASGRNRSVVRVEVAKRPERRPTRGGARKRVVIGEATLRRGRTKTTISMGNNTGPFTKIAIHSLDHSVRIRSVKVFFANGQSDHAAVNQRLGAGERTGMIEFDRARRVTGVEVMVRPILGRRLPTIKVLADPARNRRGVSLPSNWDKLARQRLSKKSGTQTIRIGTRKGRFSNIVLRGLDKSIYINDVTAVYGNGRRDRIPVYNELFAPDQTRVIHLKGHRAIKEITVSYTDSPLTNKRRKNNRQPVIEVFGETSRVARNTPPPRETSPPPQQGSGEWVLLGTRTASLFNRDTDVFRVGRDKGRFKKIRVTAKKHDIRMYGMAITYGNGNTESVSLYGTLEDGHTSTAFDLKGRHRFIDKIAFQYRTKLNFKGSGQVELWGLRAR